MTPYHRIKSFFSKDKELLKSLRNLIGFTPGNLSVYKLAFLHRSQANESKKGIKISNERLEYLGDAVLGAVVADMLFKKFPYKGEGFLTEMRSKIVSREHLNKLGNKLGIDKYLQHQADSRHKSLSGDAFEALIGAIYLDKGYAKARSFILSRIIKHHVDIDHLETFESNFKSKLIEWAQRERKSVTFEMIEEIPSGKLKLMKLIVLIDGKEIASGTDFSKKKAEQMAAAQACQQLGIIQQEKGEEV